MCIANKLTPKKMGVYILTFAIILKHTCFLLQMHSGDTTLLISVKTKSEKKQWTVPLEVLWH